MANSITLNILIARDADTFTAHCLELDIVAVAESLGDVKKEITDLIRAQIEYAFSNDNLTHLFKPAPREAWEAFYSCKDSEAFAIKTSHISTGSTDFVPPLITANLCSTGLSHIYA